MVASTYFRALEVPGTDTYGIGKSILYANQVVIPVAVTLTGIALALETTSASNAIVSLYDHTGALLAYSSSTALSGAGIKQIPFTSTYSAAAGTYYLGVQVSSSSSVPAYVSYLWTPAAQVSESTFAAPASFTPPTGPYAGTMPALCTY